jgi:hypothetical protein
MEYSLCADIGQANIPTNIAWMTGQIRWTLTGYSLGVDIGPANIQTNIA